MFSALKEAAKSRRMLSPILRLFLSGDIQSVMIEVTASMVRGTITVFT